MSGETSRSQSPSLLPPYSPLPEPLLTFRRRRHSTDSHPLRGLASHGPYTRTSLAAYSPTVRVATVGPQSSQGSVRNLIRGLAAHRPTDRTEYVPQYPGFNELFGVDVALGDDSAAHIEWPESISQVIVRTRIERLNPPLM